MSGSPVPLSVRGGVGHLAVDGSALVAIARRFGAVAEDTLAASVALHDYLVNPLVTVSAVLDPIGYARFETRLIDALDGPGGLSWASAGAGAVDAELRLAAASYARADTLTRPVIAAVDLPGALIRAGQTLAGTGDPLAAVQAVLTSDPLMADTVVNALCIPRALAIAGRRWPDGHGVLRHPGVDGVGPAGRPPRQLTDVLDDLAQRDDDPRHGEIDVRILTMPDGSRRVIVDITGTKSWDPGPTHDITSASTNGRALVGLPTAYEQGVLLALRRAGVRRTDPVMIVGHSQGGMVAVDAARDAVRSGQFHVTHVITAGSPVGLTVGAVPSSVQVLALENSADVVPHLDGRDNPERRNVVTVTGREGDGTVVGDHSVRRSYVPLGAAAEASGDASVRTYLRSAQPYFGATRVVTHTYQVQRR